MADNPRIEELRRRVQTDPASIAFAQLAEEYRRAGCFDDAVRVCRAGLERHPSYLSARVTLGRALIELQQYQDARTELEYVLRSAPENLAAIRGLAEIHQRQGNLNEALRQYQTALGIARHDPEIEESVHDLSRQLGGPPAPAPAPAAEPPPAAIDPPEPYDVNLAEPEPARQVAEPEAFTTSLSPELEAAADEFTKALQALDSIMVDVPGPSAEESPAPDEIASAGWAEAEEPQPEIVDNLPALEPSVGRAEEPHGDSVARIVNELEAWLDAIVLDRSEREAEGGSSSQGDQGDQGARGDL